MMGHSKPASAFASCAFRKLYPAVMMMKSAEDLLSSELAEPLDRPLARRILTQGQMRSNSVVIAGVPAENPIHTVVDRQIR
jgi:hypothetical protein